MGQSSEVGDAVSHQRDAFHDFSSVHQDQAAAHSANNFSPELEQSFQRVFEDPCFMQWLKLKFQNDHLGMQADYELGLEHSTNVTPCSIEEENQSPPSSMSQSSSLGPSQLISHVIHGVTPPEHEGELNYISKYLIQYVPTKKKVDTGKRATGARVLTSDECTKIILEKEEKKRKEQAEKEARKVERELKRKEKEEAAKKKAEQIAKRKEEATKKKEEAAKRKEEAARKKAEAAQKKAEAARQTEEMARKKRDGLRLQCKKNKYRNYQSQQEGYCRNRPDADDTEMYSTLNTNQCCVCFRTYEEDKFEQTGLQWVQCVCKRWVHEECYEEVLTDKNGRELICPYCVR